jgi:hypothetical protein
MIGGGLYLVIVLESVAMLTVGSSVLPSGHPAASRVVFALAALLPVYLLAGAAGGLLLGVLHSARRSMPGWILSGIVVTFMVHATSSVAGRLTLALTGLNLVDSDSLRSPWPLGLRDLALIIGAGTILGLLARRWLPVRSRQA